MKELANIPLDVLSCWVMGLLTLALLRWWIGDISQLLVAVNNLNTQAWAGFILVLGIAAALLFNRAGIAAEIAAGIVGAGLNMFTSRLKEAAAAPPTAPPFPTLPATPAQPPRE